MDQLETSFMKDVENFFTLNRRQCRPAKEITFEDLCFAHSLYKIVGDYFPPHVLYHYAVVHNETCWFSANEYMITTEKHSYESKKSYLSDDDQYSSLMYESWEDALSRDKDELVNILMRFMHKVSDSWDVNSAARSVIDNLLIAAWHYRDALTKED